MIKNKQKDGFTLVEFLIAVSIFIIVATISIGAILSVFNANKKAQSSKTVVDNLSLAIENMARTIRFGNSYYCGISSNPSSTNNCSSGSNSISITFNGNRIIYRLNGTALQRSDDGGSSYVNITAPEAVIEYVRFYIFGTSLSDSIQPYVVAVMKGQAGDRPTNRTLFNIETLISQRTIDI